MITSRPETNNPTISGGSPESSPRNKHLSFIVRQQIGSGSYGKVYKVDLETVSLLGRGIRTFEITGCQKDERKRSMALKQISVSNKGIDCLMELYILSSLSHPYIISAFQIQLDFDGNINILQPLAEGDACSIIKNKGRPPLSDLLRLSWQIVSGVAFLHSKGIVHADIKAKNILIFKDEDPNLTPEERSNWWTGTSIKLIDFGLSLPILNPDVGTRNCIAYTSTHRPLEVWKGIPWSYPADIWALGCTLYEIGYGTNLFPDQKGTNFPHESNIACHEEWARWDVHPSTLPRVKKGDNVSYIIKENSSQFLVRNPVSIQSAPPRVSDISFKTPKTHRSCSLHEDWVKPEYRMFNDLIISMLNVDLDQRATIWNLIQHPYFDYFRDERELPPTLFFPNIEVVPANEREIEIIPALNEEISDQIISEIEMLSNELKVHVEESLSVLNRKGKLSKDVLHLSLYLFKQFYSSLLTSGQKEEKNPSYKTCLILAYKILYRSLPQDLKSLINKKTILEEVVLCKRLSFNFLPTLN